MWFMVRIVRDRELMGDHASGPLHSTPCFAAIALVGLSVGGALTLLSLV
jgi:hypothetical protein